MLRTSPYLPRCSECNQGVTVTVTLRELTTTAVGLFDVITSAVIVAVRVPVPGRSVMATTRASVPTGIGALPCTVATVVSLLRSLTTRPSTSAVRDKRNVAARFAPPTPLAGATVNAAN